MEFSLASSYQLLFTLFAFTPLSPSPRGGYLFSALDAGGDALEHEVQALPVARAVIHQLQLPLRRPRLVGLRLGDRPLRLQRKENASQLRKGTFTQFRFSERIWALKGCSHNGFNLVAAKFADWATSVISRVKKRRQQR